MAEYIDKAMLINEVEHLKLFDYADKNSVRDLARSMPTVDVEPVVRGQWTDTGIPELDLTYSGWKCNICDYTFFGNKTNFCPNCGARMDGDE